MKAQITISESITERNVLIKKKKVAFNSWYNLEIKLKKRNRNNTDSFPEV